MNGTLERWNRLPTADAEQEISPCCGSAAWARQLTAARPFTDIDSLLSLSDTLWKALSTYDWDDAFSKHPRIGERKASLAASPQSAAWSEREQSGVANSEQQILDGLADANRQYEQRFGRVFIVCATGKSAKEMLDILRRRLHNDDATELLVAAEEQRKITNLRLQKWLTQ